MTMHESNPVVTAGELEIEDYDFEALDEVLAVPPPRQQGTLFPTGEELDAIDDKAFMARVTDALAMSAEDLNQGGRSARTKFKKRVMPRYNRIKAEALLRAQLGDE